MATPVDAALNSFLNKYEVMKGSDFTHTNMDPPRCYYIPSDKLDEFHNLYTRVVRKKPLSITEKHREISPVLIDFDFRQTDVIRRYSDKHVKDTIKAIVGFMKEHVAVPDIIEVFVLSKPPRQFKEYYKDGIHIIIPDIITKPQYQYAMRDVLLTRIGSIFEDCGYTNKIEDIYDKAVIEKNNWFLYGSKKPMNDPEAWKIDRIYHWLDNDVVEIENTYAPYELVDKLSIRNKYYETPILKQIDSIKKVSKPSSTVSRATTNEYSEFDCVVSLVKMLDPERADNYNDWMSVGWCLHNISDKLLDLWIEFSRLSSKYKDGECEKLWNSMKSSGLGIGSLHFWAKNDDPVAYKSVVSNNVYKDIKTCDGSHGSVAMVTYKILKHKYVCATPDGKSWYVFNGTLWKEDMSELNLRRDISMVVRDQYLQIMNRIASSASIDDMQSGKTSSTNDPIKKDCERLLKIAMKLRDSSFKDCVIKELRELCYNEDFIEKLDSNPNLIGFNNGVFCLKDKLFRNASPDDFLSYSVGYDYITETNEEISELVSRYFERLHPNKEQREYVLKMFARQMYGDSGGELFHVHAGAQASAGNGKSVFFQVLELCFGKYVHRFPVEMLVCKQRGEAGRPRPDLKDWRGVRINYTTEPNSDDKLNSGILKELSGGESIKYRMLFSNKIHTFRPMFKLHIMCNDAPGVDGGDEGVKRRIRKIDYISKFVNKEDVDEANNMYEKDPNFIEQFKRTNAVKMEFARYILSYYDHSYKFEMPDVIKRNSNMYIEENNNVLNFVKECIVKDPTGFFTLKEAKERFKMSQHFNGKLTTLKNELQKVLKIECFDQKKINGKNVYYVFIGYTFKIDSYDINHDGL